MTSRRCSELRRVDVGTIARLATGAADSRVDAGQRSRTVFFLNCCGFGFDVAVLEQIAAAHWLRGNSVYLYTALSQLFRYLGCRAGPRGQRTCESSALHLLLVIANTEYFGGMFRIAPGASVTDGALDAVAIRDAAPLRRLLMLAAAAKGMHVTHEQCANRRASEFRISFPFIPSYETDGELHRATTSVLTVTSCPSALRVITAPGEK